MQICKANAWKSVVVIRAVRSAVNMVKMKVAVFLTVKLCTLSGWQSGNLDSAASLSSGRYN